MHARLRKFASLFIVCVPFAADAADEPRSVGVVYNVEKRGQSRRGRHRHSLHHRHAGPLRNELRTGPEGRLKGHLPRRYRADSRGETLTRHWRDSTPGDQGPLFSSPQTDSKSSSNTRSPSRRPSPISPSAAHQITVSNQLGNVTLSGTGPLDARSA